MASKNTPSRGKQLEPPIGVKPRYLVGGTWTPRSLRTGKKR